MKSLQATKLVLLALIIPTLWGCSSDKLSRGKAEKIIKEKLQLPKDEIEALNIEYTTLGSETATFINLQKEGLLTYTNEWGGMTSYVQGNLTEKGKQYAVSDKYATDNYHKDIKVKVAKLEFGEITGIVETKEFNMAVVNYTLVRKVITPFGKIAFSLQEGVFNASATFTKYDDGWRIVE